MDKRALLALQKPWDDLFSPLVRTYTATCSAATVLEDSYIALIAPITIEADRLQVLIDALVADK